MEGKALNRNIEYWGFFFSVIEVLQAVHKAFDCSLWSVSGAISHKLIRDRPNMPSGK